MRPILRTDIQVLRGIAVLLVVLYHSELVELKGGYLGVDIFFVISGFLITGLIMREIASGRFSIQQFYWRRAKRLLPASFVVLLLTALAASVLLTDSELAEFNSQLIGATTFTANIVLWRQTGYFEAAADVKPLLHMWSLAVEEQFYLVVPAALLLVSRRWWAALITAGTVASAVLCFYLVEAHPAAAFYLLPTRAWQLGIGALAAVANSRMETGARPLVGLLALGAILVLAVNPLDPVHPRGGAVLASLASAAVILARPAFLNRGLISLGLSRIGDISYSLYLVHWPFFAFAKVIYVGERTPSIISAGLLAVSFVLAWLLYVFVERPIHRSRIAPTLASISSFASCAILVLVPSAWASHLRKGGVDWQYVTRPNFGLAEMCDYSVPFVPRQECMTGPQPTVLVWGDSFAMMMVSGMVAEDAHPELIQATRSACAPIPGVAPGLSKAGQASAQQCIDFNSSVLQHALSASSVTHVVLSGGFAQFWRASTEGPPGDVEGNADFQRALSAMSQTIDTLRAAGKKVVIIAQLPATGADMGLCNKRRLTDRLVLGQSPECSFDRAEVDRYRDSVARFLNEIERRSDVTVLWPADLLCDETRCVTRLDGVPIYRDAGHLTYEGSALFARQFDLNRRILREAR